MKNLMILVVGLLMISLAVGGLGGVISKDKTIPSRDINSKLGRCKNNG